MLHFLIYKLIGIDEFNNMNLTITEDHLDNAKKKIISSFLKSICLKMESYI